MLISATKKPDRGILPRRLQRFRRGDNATRYIKTTETIIKIPPVSFDSTSCPRNTRYPTKRRTAPITRKIGADIDANGIEEIAAIAPIPTKRIMNEKADTDDEISSSIRLGYPEFEFLITEIPKPIPHKTAINNKIADKRIGAGILNKDP
jgi:hypothetical protein